MICVYLDFKISHKSFDSKEYSGINGTIASIQKHKACLL